MPTIAAVVVTYNRKDLLLECLNCLQSQDYSSAPHAANTRLDILVIDNASTDGTADALLPLINNKTILYFNTGSNLGGAGGFNFGMRIAVESGYDYVWVMDDDCMPHPNTLEELLNAADDLNYHFGFLSSVCRWIDGSICTMNVQRHPLTRSIRDFSLALQPATLASFVSLFVPSSVIEMLGLPIKDFFIWSDDWEFTRRISREYPCYLAGKSVVTHKSKSNGTGNIALDTEDKISRYRLAYRNDMVLYRREGVKGYLYVLARGAYHALLVLTKSKSKKIKRLKTIWKGNIEGIRFHPEIEYIAAQKTD